MVMDSSEKQADGPAIQNEQADDAPEAGEQEECDAEGERMRRELREMRAEVQSLRGRARHASDKKARRQLEEQLSRLEAGVAQRRGQLEAHEAARSAGEAHGRTRDAAERAMAARGARDARRRERERSAAAEAAALAGLVPRLGAIELESIEARVLSPLGLGIHEIPADGDCLFAALAHQLNVGGGSHTPASLRAAAATHIEGNAEHYVAFLETPDGDVGAYCARLRRPGELWGGHVELDALAAALSVPIHVHAAEGAPHVFGDSNAPGRPPARLLYRRHAYALGEHYDSLVPRA